jgi:hypothetical protein
LIVARPVYGENINRFYRRGLARLEKLDWEIAKIDTYQTYHRAQDARAISDRHGRLVPPEMWKLQRGVRVRVLNILQRGTNPESVDYIMPELRELIAKVGRPLLVSAIPKSAEEIERNRRAYQHVARLEPARTANPIGPDLPPPSFQEEVTELLANSSPTKSASEASIYSERGPPAASRSSIRDDAAAAEASEKRRADFLGRRQEKALREALERLRKFIPEE